MLLTNLETIELGIIAAINRKAAIKKALGIVVNVRHAQAVVRNADGMYFVADLIKVADCEKMGMVVTEVVSLYNGTKIRVKHVVK